MIKNRIKLLREKFSKFNIDGYIIPKNDDYFGEYSEVNYICSECNRKTTKHYDKIFNFSFAFSPTIQEKKIA